MVESETPEVADDPEGTADIVPVTIRVIPRFRTSPQRLMKPMLR